MLKKNVAIRISQYYLNTIHFWGKICNFATFVSVSLTRVFFLSGRNGLPALSHGFFNSVMLWRAGPQGLVISKRYLEISLTEQTKSAPYTKWCTKCSVACFFQESYLRWKKLVIAMLSMVIYWKFSQVSTGNLSSKTVQNVWQIHCI